MKQLSLPKIIKKKYGIDVHFSELETLKKRAVLDYIQKHNLNIKVFEKKWFDILSNKFYVVEYKPWEDSEFGVQKIDLSFDCFDEFFCYVNGDIYENTCLYGYVFNDEIIKKYSIDIKKINFDSFTTEEISSYTYEKIVTSKRSDSTDNAKRAQKIIEWIKNCKPIRTLDELESALSKFNKSFDFWEAKKVFFSMIIRKDPITIKNAIIKYVCKFDIYDGITFDNVLKIYGKEDALSVINNFNGMCSYSTKLKRIRSFKSKLEAYESGLYDNERRFGFNYELQLYFVEDIFFNAQYSPIRITEYFGSFDEFVLYVNGDLCGADLSDAPLTSEEISKYKIDTKTKLPPLNKYEYYDVIKKYSRNEFVVKQRWYDKNDIVILGKEHCFETFFDFVHFLKGDLSNADLLLCDGLENIKHIKGLNLDGVKVRSEVAEKLGLPVNILPDGLLQTKCFDQSDKYEIETVDTLLGEHVIDDDYSGKISYITDIHLLHRFDAYKCKTQEDVNYVIRTIAKTIGEQATRITLIGGDTSSDFDVFKSFVGHLHSANPTIDYFFTLGNHELWGKNGDQLPEIIEQYREVLRIKGKGNMHLVQNNLFYADMGWNEITEEELSKMSLEQLREKTRGAYVIIFGGIGFAGMSDEFNADNGIYMDVLDREGETKESTKFLMLYEKVTTALKDKNLVVLTHMPMKDWGGGDMHAKEGIVYVNGHSHRNYFYDDGKKRIYADNQVGYRGRRLSLKQVSINFNYDWFADYKDGIYEITKEDYEKFYRGVGEGLTFNREFDKLFMIKREGTYMFLMRTPKGSMLILNGGAIKKAGNHPLDYFYDNMVKYSKSVRLFLSKYDEYQKKISAEVKKIGGDGRIHGSIIDIDFYNHLYLNPLDGTITPYFAYSMVDKYVFDNVPSLLKYHCPELYENYKALVNKKTDENALVLVNKSLQITKNEYYVDSTEMYKVSRILKGLQFTTKYNIVRLWNDRIIADASEENGRLIVSGIINPDSMPSPVVEPKPRIIRESKPKVKKPVLTKEEKQAIKFEKYRNDVLEKSNDKIDVEVYRGSKDKSDYVCLVCGYRWSMRSDHLKRRNFTCPNCVAPKQDKVKEGVYGIHYSREGLREDNEKEELVIEKKHEESGIKTERKNIRNNAMDILLLSTIISNNGTLTKKQLIDAISSNNSLISKNAIINSLSRIEENEEIIFTDDKISISEKGMNRLKI